MSSQDIAGVAMLTVSLIFGALLLHSGVHYYGIKGRDETLYHKRRGNIVMMYTACSLVFLAVALPLFFVGSGRYLLHKSGDEPVQRTLRTIHYVLFYPSFNLCTFLCVSRYWLISYDIKLADSLSSMEWKKYITQSMAAIKKEMWYIRHRAIFGNARYVCLIALLVAVPLSILMIIDNALWNYGIYSYAWISWVAGGIIYLCALLALFKIWCSTPYINDNICLFGEFRAMTYVLSVVWLLWLLSMVAFNVLPMLWGLVTIHFAMQICTFAMSFISTFWYRRQMGISIPGDGSLGMDEQQLPPTVTEMVPQRSIWPFEEILSSELLLNAFMAHLNKEFSIECLLSLIEFCQFRNYGIQNLDLDGKRLSQIDIDWPAQAKLPLSDIVHANSQSESADTFLSYKHKAHALYVKYIAKDADFEINISYRRRYRLHRLMHDYEDWMSSQNTIQKESVLMIFDECINSMLQLLRASQHRFKFEHASPKLKPQQFIP